MQRFNVKSIILGIGIGIVIISFISMIYLAGSNPKGELSEEEIINEALKLGMVKAQDTIKTEGTVKDKGSVYEQKDIDNTNGNTSGKTSDEISRQKTAKIK